MWFDRRADGSTHLVDTLDGVDRVNLVLKLCNSAIDALTRHTQIIVRRPTLAQENTGRAVPQPTHRGPRRAAARIWRGLAKKAARWAGRN